MAVLLDFLHRSYERYVLVTSSFSFLRYKGREETSTQLRLIIISGHTNYPSLGVRGGDEYVSLRHYDDRQSAKRGNDVLNNKQNATAHYN